MADHQLKAMTPLGAASPKIETFDGVRIEEIVSSALASVAARKGKTEELRDAAKTALGLDLPPPGKASSGEPYSCFWMGPDQWMVEAPFASHEDIADRLQASLGGNASVTEQTDGWARFDITSSRAIDLFEILCPVDVAEMQAGDATRSLMEHVGIFLVCRKAREHFSVLGPRSSAVSLHHALSTATRSILATRRD